MKESEQTLRFNVSELNLKFFIQPQGWHPLTDVIETEQEIIIRLEISGMKEDGFIISFKNKILTISGVRTIENPVGIYHQMEIHFGQFVENIKIPFNINSKTVSTKYEKGFLILRLSKIIPHQINFDN